jgi:chaperonin GroEL (HSP60 family)
MDYETGDGTTSAVILAGELVKNAGRLIEDGLHPTIIDDGYRMGMKKAISLMEELAITTDEDTLRNTAKTAFCTKYSSKDLPDIIVDAVLMTEEEGEAHPERVHTVKKKGGDIYDTYLFPGFIIEKEMLHPSMPKEIEDAKIALLDVPLTVKRYEGLFGEYGTPQQCNVCIDDVNQRNIQKEGENSILWRMIRRIMDTGANFIVSRKVIDERVGKRLADAGISAVECLPTKEDLDKFSLACGAKIITDVDRIESKDLGFAELVKEEIYADRSVFTFVSTQNAKSATIVMEGMQRTMSDLDRAIRDAVWTSSNAFNDRILPGGGATEMYISGRIKKMALSIRSKKQLALFAFADALEIIPKTLARNCGKDQISMILALRKAHSEGDAYRGVNSHVREMRNVIEDGIVEPLKTKEEMYKEATETARTVLLSDDIIYGEVIEERIEET